MNTRRALSNLGGPIETVGEPSLTAILREAFAATEQLSPDVLTHGFHAYPARMHPATARVLVQACAPEGGTVLDPFCGSGTVLVEAMRANRRALGADLNPLALRIADVHCMRPGKSDREGWRTIVDQVCEASLEHVRNRDDIRAPLSGPMARMYEGHTLRELAGLMHEIEQIEDEAIRTALEVVFSSLVVKLSKKRADTADEQVDKRIRKGLPTELFARKCDELQKRWTALVEETPLDAPAPKLVLSDVRLLGKALGDRRAFGTAGGTTRCDAVITSPPYGGTYDYYEHHALRLAWLGLVDRDLEQHELGARRRMSKVGDPIGTWDHEVLGMLKAIGGALTAKGNAVLLMGDAQLQRQRVDAREQIGRLAERWGLSLRASASQERVDWQGGRPRREHLLWLSPHGAAKR